MNDEDNEGIPCLNGNIIVSFDNFVELLGKNASLRRAKREMEELIENLCTEHGIVNGSAFGFQDSLHAIDKALRRLNEIIRPSNK